MANPIKMGHDLSLPIDAVTEKLAWLGRTGSGKTYGAKRMVEQMLRARAHVIVIDPVGTWAGLRLGPKAFDVPVLGGLHGDIPLEPGAGSVVADLVVDRQVSVVLDVSQMIDADRTRFATGFAGRFYQRQKAAPRAVHVVLEECQDFIPQNQQHGEERMLHEFHRICKVGRNFGIGVSLITQRPQEVSKKALNQTECVFAFQMTGPQERKALEYWLSDKGFTEKLSDVLPRLEVGAPHVWSPMWLKLSKVVHILPIDSLDTSRTPKVGARAFTAAKLSPIDLENLRTQMADAIERALADDPKALRARIVELERELKARPAAESVRVEVPLLDEATKASMDALGEAMGRVSAQFEAVVLRFGDAAWRGYREAEKPRPAPRQIQPAFSHPRAPTPRERHQVALSRCARAILGVVAQRAPAPTTAAQAAILSGYSVTSSGFANALSELRTKGLIEGSRDELRVTTAGIEVTGPVSPLPSGEALVDYWKGKLGRCEREILQVLVDARGALPKSEIATRSGYSETSSGFANALSKLRTLQLADGYQEVRASEVFR
jgi:hypothetical protein